MAVDRKQVADKVYSIVAELTSTAPGQVKGGDRLREDLGLDSMQSMELLSRVSEEFEVDPDMEQVMRVSTIDEVVSLLAGHLNAA
jgi:acyl carrier protein